MPLKDVAVCWSNMQDAERKNEAMDTLATDIPWRRYEVGGNLLTYANILDNKQLKVGG